MEEESSLFNNTIKIRLMSPRAQRSSEALPREIKYFEEGSSYQFIVGVDEVIKESWHRDPGFDLLRSDLVHLARYYTTIEKLTDKQAASLCDQLCSTDKEAWLLAFVILDQINKSIEKG